MTATTTRNQTTTREQQLWDDTVAIINQVLEEMDKAGAWDEAADLKSDLERSVTLADVLMVGEDARNIGEYMGMDL